MQTHRLKRQIDGGRYIDTQVGLFSDNHYHTHTHTHTTLHSYKYELR